MFIGLIVAAFIALVGAHVVAHDDTCKAGQEYSAGPDGTQWKCPPLEQEKK